MPSLVTHVFVGLAFSRFLSDRAGIRPKKMMFAIAACIPDMDSLSFLLKIPYTSPWGHRGFCHSIVFAVIISVIFEFFYYYKRNSKINVKTMSYFFTIVMSHDILDAMTDAGEGVGFFIPFTSTRYFFPIRPIRAISLNPAFWFTSQTLSVFLSELQYIWVPVLTVLLLCEVVVKNF